MHEVPSELSEMTDRQRQILEATRIAIVTTPKLRAEAKRVTAAGVQYQKQLRALVREAGLDLLELSSLEAGMVSGLVTAIGLGKDPDPFL